MIIIRDTREKIGYWDFSFFGHDEKVTKLDTGDYSLVGYENILCIERKKSTSEIATNIGKDCKRFEAELLRMKDFKHKYLILEFSVANLLEFPKNSGMTKVQMSKVRINPQFLMKRLNEYEQDYGITVIFAGNKDNAIDVALDIFNEVVNEI